MVNLNYMPRGPGNRMYVELNALSNKEFLQLTGKLPAMEILRNLESIFIPWIQMDIYFLASTNYCVGAAGEGPPTGV